jgi:hypothetical protein
MQSNATHAYLKHLTPMKNRHTSKILVLLSWGFALGALAQSAAFNYNGRLNQNGAPANGHRV